MILIWLSMIAGECLVLGTIVASAKNSSISSQVDFVLVTQIILWPMWRTVAWPGVRLYDNGLLVVNRLKVSWISWSKLDSVDVSRGLTLNLVGGDLVVANVGTGKDLRSDYKNIQRRKLQIQIERERRNGSPNEVGVVISWVDLYLRIALPIASTLVASAILVTAVS